MDYSRLGCYAEYLFAVKCMESGFDVSMPLLNVSTYDAIVDTGSRLIKVQIKSSFLPADEKRNTVKVSVRQNGKNDAYQVNEIDYLALYTDHYKGFFILPYLEVQKYFRLNPEGKHKKYFNNFAFDL